MTTVPPAAAAPLTQDTPGYAPKAAEGLRPLVGLTRPQLIEALVEAGTPEGQAKMRATQL